MIADETGCKVSGIDINQAELVRAFADNISKPNKVGYSAMSGAALGFPERTFDPVVLLGTLRRRTFLRI